MMAIGFTGVAAAPSTLVLAFPVDASGVLRTAGSTTVLAKTAARAVAPLLHPTGYTFQRTFTWVAAAPRTVNGASDQSVERGAP